MQFFRKIVENVDIKPFLDELEKNEAAWGANTSRQDQIKVQSETQTIYMRGPVKRQDLDTRENQESEWTEMSKKFPACAGFMEDVAKRMGGSLSRATIVRLKPNGNVYLHIDDGAYYFIRHRMHFVVQSKQGSILMSGGETVKMKEGELWWFDNRQHHQAINNSDDWRIHFIFDVLPDKYKDIAKNPLHIDEVMTKLKKQPDVKVIQRSE